jgi:calcineurin-like phosphoesterase
MTGPHESILGRKIQNVLSATTSFRPIPFDVAKNDVQISGVVIEVEPKTGKATKISRIKINERQAEMLELEED